jgi:hypothetical protein
LPQIPGVGALVSTAVVSAIGNRAAKQRNATSEQDKTGHIFLR